MSEARPHNAVDLIGHEAAERVLLDAHGSGRMHHAWLIGGPRGIGKATLAYRFARFVLAHPPQEGEAGPDLFGDPPPAPTSLHVAPEHPVFHRVAAASHGDLVTVACGVMPDGRPRSEIVVEDVRALGDFFAKTSAEGGWRVAVVDSADVLNRNAANALLKILEEPPARALLLLVAHAPGRVLPTILSRCRRLTLRPLDRATVETFIASRYPDLAETDGALVAALSDGSPGQAAALIDAKGIEIYRRLLDILARLPQLDYAAVNAFSAELGGRGGEEGFRLFVGLLGDMLARVARTASTGSTAGALPEEEEVLRRLSQIAGLDRWIEVWEKSTGLLQRVDGLNLDRRQVVIGVLHDLAAVTRP